MKLDPWAFSNGPNNENLGRRKRQQDAVRMDAAIKTALDELADDEERRAAFLRLLACVRTLTALLKPTPWPRQTRLGRTGVLINRLKNLAARQSHWIRPCETWRSDGSNLRPEFRSLAHHLLTHYPVPGFMDSAWDLAGGPVAFRQQSWFIRLGRGTPVRALNLPLVLTRRMEHYVRQAPDHYTAAQALRNGEARGFGGGEELVREIAIGPLGQRIEHADFWRTVLSFFVAHTEMKREHVKRLRSPAPASEGGRGEGELFCGTFTQDSSVRAGRATSQLLD